MRRVHPMAMSAARARSLPAFFVLVFALAAPFWVIGGLTGMQLTPDLPVSALQFVCPGIAAAILVYRESGAAGLNALLRRSFDYERIGAKVWYIPTVLLQPVVYALTFGLMSLMGMPLPAAQFPILAALATFLVFFVSGVAEELGWTGYAIDPMQARWDALRASIFLGVLWAVFHYIPLLQGDRSLAWIGWWALGTVAMRILLTWIYNNTGKSVFAAAVFHAMGNLSSLGPFLNFGPGGYPFAAQRISGLMLAIVAATVILLWGPRTLARFRTM
ncbi:MAG: CPBP family intramembrane glutamic endopeptidase [Thermomicrobiales bacterium]